MITPAKNGDWKFSNIPDPPSTRIRILNQICPSTRIGIRSSIQDSSVTIVNRAWSIRCARSDSISFSGHVEYLRD